MKITIFSTGSMDLKIQQTITSWQFSISFENATNSSKPGVCNTEAMKDVLLVITYIDITSEKMLALEDLYKNNFPNILFCGSNSPETGSKSKILTYDIQHGITAYACLAGAIKDYPKHKGYLFIKSDLFVNYWTIAELDPHRIWQTRILGNQAIFEQSREQWIWWYTAWGLKACEKAYKKMVYLNSVDKLESRDDQHKEESNWDIENSLNALLWNGHGRYHCYHGDANIFYIPAKYAVAFERMARIFEEFGVFSEIAVSTIIKMLELQEKNIFLEGVDLGKIYGEERAAWDSALFMDSLNSSRAYVRPLFAKDSGYYEISVREILTTTGNQKNCLLKRKWW